ncbi:MAG TPA: hypothetical protein VNP04_30265 [Alphaproteobacteria bacterium]|nr:hypothetical protein [Alphaproteobacteria bacterium]
MTARRLAPIRFKVPGRILGNPPQTAGNLRRITVDIDTQVRESCRAIHWNPETAMPSQARLLSLGPEEVARDFYREG